MHLRTMFEDEYPDTLKITPECVIIRSSNFAKNLFKDTSPNTLKFSQNKDGSIIYAKIYIKNMRVKLHL